MFLLVPAYPGCPGSKAVKRSLLLFLFFHLLISFWANVNTGGTSHYGAKQCTKPVQKSVISKKHKFYNNICNWQPFSFFFFFCFLALSAIACVGFVADGSFFENASTSTV